MLKEFKTLGEDFRRYKNSIILGLLALVIVDLLQLFIPRIIKYGIDSIMQGMKLYLLKYALYILIISIFIAVFRFGWRYFIGGTSRKIERRLRNRLISHLQTLSMNFFKNMKTGDIMAHCTNDIDAVSRAIRMGTILIIDIIVLGTLSIVFMVFISPRLTVYALIPLIPLSFITLRFSKMIHKRFEVVQAAFSGLSIYSQENISGIKVIRSLGQEQGTIQRFGVLCDGYVDKNMKLIKIWGLFFPLIFLFANCSICLILFFGGKEVIFSAITMGDFVAFQTYLGILTWPMIAIGWVFNLISRGSASMGRINRILETKPEIKSVIGHRLSVIGGKIEFRNVSFSYNGKPVLKSINLCTEPGKKMGITGRIGSGKSTLVSLIPRLFDPQEGEILLDNKRIKDTDLKQLRASIGFVPQESFLFSTTIKDNILFGKPGASGEEVEFAAKIAGIYHEIMEFPSGFDTVVGERGVTLSGGQRQRIAIARAILKDPQIFIFDDSFSSVDSEKEVFILNQLKEALKEKSIIMISHRIGALKNSDEIIVLDNGEIVERGTHSQLISIQGIYANLWHKQQIEEKLQ